MHEESNEQASPIIAQQEDPVEFGRDDLANLVGYFDVLIQRDIEQRLNQQKGV
jgi:hypothetical protein